MKKLVSLFGIMSVLTMLLTGFAHAASGDVTITFWGQSAFKLESAGKTVLIDPWITRMPGVPVCPVTVDDINAADLILITHDHFDHVGDTYDAAGNTIHAGDTIAIAKKTGAIVVAEYETAQRLMAEGLPPANVLYGGYGRSIGGAIDINGIDLVMTPAVHSSDSGVPVGHIIKFPGGATVYHAGDTAIFSDMRIYGALYPLDMALLPIGGAFTMDAVQAAESLRLLKPGKAIPMHYGTFPMLAQNADQFVTQAKKVAPEVKIIVLKPGERYILQPKAAQ